MYGCEFTINGYSTCVELSTQKKIKAAGLPVTKEVIGKIWKKDGWRFNWKDECKKSDRNVFYLRTCTEDRRVQGLISATPLFDEKYIFLHLIENAPHNMGPGKQYDFVPACLIAYMCKASFDLGMEGYVAFVAKSALIDHYIRKYGAEMINQKQNRMCITSWSAIKLVNLYIKNF